MAEPDPSLPGSLERDAHEVLESALHAPVIETFGAAPEADPSVLERRKNAADHLVKLRLMRYEDEGRTRLSLTNPGRYWALHGGYMAFLKEDPDRAATGGNGSGRTRNPDLEQLRFNFMMLRMRTFWWSFGISIASFLLSIASLYFALRYGGALLNR
jgi:hypothetical protein